MRKLILDVLYWWAAILLAFTIRDMITGCWQVALGELLVAILIGLVNFLVRRVWTQRIA